ncbi:MAG TPA: lipid-A-disaccharide synthase [Devosia sp.]|nr:lipid-A-disaccharide synthase [Devosia sp.]
MAEPVRIFVGAGELSGDHLGADLVRRLRRRVGLDLSGIGGPELSEEGLHSLFPMSDLAVMGIVDVAARFPLLWWRVRQTVNSIMHGRPDVVVLIDSQVFSATVAKRVRKAGYRGPVLLYVAPSVWAFRPQRARIIRNYFDEILAIYHFEPQILRDLGGPTTTYVGHPALERSAIRPRVPERGPLLLLPGSRAGELRRHLPLMAEIAKAFVAHPRVSELVLPTPTSELAHVEGVTSRWTAPVRVVSDTVAKKAAFAEAIAAAATAGTVTLELALAGVPMAVTYVSDRPQYRRWLSIDRPFTALPNILARRRVVPDGVVTSADPKTMIAEIRRLLEDRATASEQVRQFVELAKLMSSNVTDPAERVLAHLPQRLLSGT